MKKRKGITLIELMLALALVSIVIVIAFNFFSFGNKVQVLALNESQDQADLRLVTEHINKITRYATKAYTIPKSSFQHSEDGVRDPNVSYIGITKDGHIVIDEPGDNEGDPRKIQYIAKKQDGVEHEISFHEVFDEVADANGKKKKIPNMLTYKIESYRDGKLTNTIESTVELMNSLQLDYLGTDSDPAVAIAFSMLDPGSQEFIEVTPDAYIVMVIDTSGSMDWDMDGYRNRSPKRIDILKEKATSMINRLSDLGFKVHVSIVPFSENANDPWDFVDINDKTKDKNNKTKKENLITRINNITPDGATNTGDGLRQAYYKLYDKTLEVKNTKRYTQHIMVLVDGATNTETKRITSRGGGWFFGYYVKNSVYDLKKGNTGSLAVGNLYPISTSENDDVFIKKIGNELIKNHTYGEENQQKIDSFVIGFSNNKADHGSLQSIGDALNGKEFDDGNKYIIATNADELDFAFEQFESEVENNLWLITRPKLWP